METVTVKSETIDNALCANAELLKIVPQVFEAHGVPDVTTLQVFKALTELRHELRSMLPELPAPHAPVAMHRVDDAILFHQEIAAVVGQQGAYLPADVSEQLRGIFTAFLEGLEGLRG